MLFLVILEDDKSGNFLRGDKPFLHRNARSRAKSRINDVASKYHLRHFRKVKTDIFVNVIYRGCSLFG